MNIKKRIIISSLSLLIIALSSVISRTTLAEENEKNPFDKWTLSGDAYINEEGHLILTEAKEWNQGYAWYNDEVIGTFYVEFDFKIGGGTGGDGFIFAFNKNKDNRGNVGGELGFGEDGLGIEFDAFYNSEHNDPFNNPHIAFIRNNISTHEVSIEYEEMTDFEWHRAKIDVSPISVKVIVDDQVLIDYEGDINQDFNNIGFSATTGSKTNWHIINLNTFRLEIIDDFGKEKKVNPDTLHSYFRYDYQKTYDQAKEICENQGGYLATIQNAAEQLYVTNKILNDAPYERYFLGGNDTVTEGIFKWETGEPFIYDVFDRTVNNFNSSLKNYISIMSKTGLWYVIDESYNKGGFICEWSPPYTSNEKQEITSITLNHGNKTFDLVKDIYILDLGNTDQYTLKVNINWRGKKVKEIRLQQQSTILSSTNGKFELNNTIPFTKNTPIYAYGIADDGTRTKLIKLGLQIKSSSDE